MGSTTPFHHPRYRLLRLLGEGGMGRVHLAEDRLDADRKVALKVYPSRYSDDRLRREFVALRELRHPSIARAFHFGVTDDDGAPFFTLEYVKGRPLNEALWDAYGSPGARNAPPARRLLEATLPLLRKTAAALAYLHRRNILHLDVKPENLLLPETAPGPESRPALIDFGLVRAFGGADAPVGHATLPYAAPELLESKAPTPASDVYSLAATFYHVLAGKAPVEGKSLAELRRAHRSRHVPPLSGVPRGLESILMRALAKDPAQRYPDALELARALESPAIGSTHKARVAFHEPDFVGRKEELEAVRTWLQEDRRRHPVLAFTGGGGWGKTRLLERIETDLELASKKTLFLRSTQEEGRGLLERAHAGASVLRGETVSTEPPPRHGSSDTSLPSLEEAVADAAAVLLPLLCTDTFLIIDDVDRAGEFGSALVARLRQRLGEHPTPPGGGIVVSASVTISGAREHALGPLDRKEALRIELEGLSGALSSLSADRVRRLKSSLYEAVGGHPLFFARGLLALAGDSAGAQALAPVAQLERQLELLDPAARELITILSTLDRSVSLSELVGVLGGRDGGIDPAIEGLRRAGWIVVERDHVRVIHDSITSAVIGALSKAERASFHLRVATALERLRPGARSRAHLLQAAWHSLRGGSTEHAAELCARWSTKPTPVPESLTGRAAEVLTKCAERGQAADVDARKLLESAAALLERAGRYGESSKLLGRVARGADSQDYTLRRKVGSLALRSGDTTLAARHLRACVSRAAAEAAPEESILAAAELALLQHFAGKTDEALDLADRGVALWKNAARKVRERTRQSAAKLHGILGQVHLRRLDFEPAIERLSEGLRLAEASDTKPNIALLLNNLALAHHLAGRFPAALETFERAGSLARELHDLPALTSITANVVQIHAKRGRFQTATAMLDELERSPAARQSPRLRLGCLYSRGLLLNLRQGHAESHWREVEEVAETVGDHFLARFARLYHAEGALFCGQPLAARERLAKRRGKETTTSRVLGPVHEVLRASRAALAEALLGQETRSKRLQDSCEARAELPAMLAAWTDYFLGLAALETERFDVAEAALKRASRVFDATDFAVGRLECALARVDLHLSRHPARGDDYACAQRHLTDARELEFEAQSDAGEVRVRERGMRTALLEARGLCLELARWVEHGRAPDSLDTLERRLGDLLARVAGDTRLNRFPQWQLELDALQTVAHRLRGETEEARRTWQGAEKRRRRVAAALPAREREAYRRRDIWQRLGIAALRPHTPTGGRQSSRGLEALIDSASEGTAEDMLTTLVERLDATSVEFLQSSGSTPAATSSERDPERAAHSCFAFVRQQGQCLGILRARRKKAFTASDGVFLEAAAKLIALRADGQPPAAPATSSDEAPTRLLEPGSPENTEKTATLPVTRTLELTSKSSLTDILRDEGVVAGGAHMRRILATVERLALADVPVLITGESGTGKDVIARLIHRLGPRASGPYLSQNASALPEELFEADLFGYEQGAFTGAEQTRTGFLFRAGGGTFHLEEIGDLPAVVQQRLLRVLEENVVRPLGATSPLAIDVRFVASTHCDIESLVRDGAFRKDLFFRLCGATVHLSPLRERIDEIPALAEHYWHQLTGSSGRFPASARRALQEHDWPGNVRELITVLRRLALEASGLPSAGEIRGTLGKRRSSSPFSSALFETHSYEDLKRSLDEAHLRHLFETHRGDLERIATVLGTSTRSVYRKFSRLGLKPKDFSGKSRRQDD